MWQYKILINPTSITYCPGSSKPSNVSLTVYFSDDSSDSPTLGHCSIVQGSFSRFEITELSWKDSVSQETQQLLISRLKKLAKIYFAALRQERCSYEE